MTEFSLPKVSKAEVARAGKILAGPILHDDAAIEDCAKIFRIAYDWRNSHQYPTQRMRHELTGKVRKFKLQGITAGRTKRMSSITKKLMRSPVTLAQIQDLGGCRAIVASIPQVNELVDFYRAGGSAHELQKDQSYIEKPKDGGYRSHHFVLRFEGQPEEEAFRGRKIELQIRTKLQHAWATAVEAVGMVRNEDLKAGEGNPDWLRLFALMSSEFAEIEGCPLVPGTFDVEARRQEIRDLDHKLEAAATLGKINSAVTVAGTIGPANANFFLVQYDGVRHTLRIKGYTSPRSGSDQYALDEDGQRSLNSVLVDVDKADNLREAYPNYFLDVATFATSIMKITGTGRGLPRGAQELPNGARGYDTSFLQTWKKRSQTQGG